MHIPTDLVEALHAARHVAVSSGAGISAESGIATFRQAQTGLWARFKPEDLATPEAFERQPETVWDWYEWRREQVRNARPNPGHMALAKLAQRVPRLSLITQNVDGLHQRAGSRSVIELHGSLMKSVCHITGQPISDRQLADATGRPPRSPHHPEGMARPGVVWFGEALPSSALEQAMAAAADADLFFSVGTSSLVEPAASLPRLALQRGIPVVEINPEPTPLTVRARFVLSGPSGEILPALLDALDAFRRTCT